MKKTTINIEIEEGKVRASSDSPINVLQMLEVTFALQLQAMNNFIAMIPSEDKEAVKEDLFDKYNQAASNILDMFAPEYELHPGLTAEAILKAENEIIEAEYDKLKNAD